MRDVYRRAPPDLSPGCLHTVSPRRRPVRPAPQPPPLRPLPARVSRPAPPDTECELACDASCLDGRSSPTPAPAAARRPPTCMAPLTVRGEEELPSQAQGEGEARADGERSGGAWSAGARAYVTLPRRRGVAAVLFRNAPLPPRRTTPDGTDIYYWCDVPRRKLTGTEHYGIASHRSPGTSVHMSVIFCVFQSWTTELTTLYGRCAASLRPSICGRRAGDSSPRRSARSSHTSHCPGGV